MKEFPLLRLPRHFFVTIACVVMVGSLVVARASPGEPDAGASLYALKDVFQQDDGAAVRLDHWAGRPVLMAMAYSSCRETCSYTMHRLEELEKAATSRGQPIEIVIVSYDPRVDDATVWSSYRRRHRLNDSHWHFLVGSDQATRAFASMLGLRFWNYDEHVMHEFGITLVDSTGHISRVLHWTNRNENLLAAANPP